MAEGCRPVILTETHHVLNMVSGHEAGALRRRDGALTAA
jgi:hypothetical protein